MALLWVLFAGSVSGPELAGAAIAATLAMSAVYAVATTHLAAFSPRLRWIATAIWLPWYAVSGTAEILVVLARHLIGRPKAPSLLLAAAYGANRDDAADATRRALAVTYTTITPNFVVVDIDTDRGLMIFHQLRESETPKMTRDLGAEG